MKPYKLILLLLLIGGAAYVLWRQHAAPYRHAEGKIFGTYYNITYQSDEDLDGEILSALNSVDASLSMFNPSSTISKMNRGEDMTLDGHMARLLPRALEICRATGGAFDVTVAPLVNAWGFGFKNEEWPSRAEIDSLMTFVGWGRIRIEGNKLVKDDPRVMIDLSAIAKGYGADVAAGVMERNRVANYMIEIGGDLVTKGKSARGGAWSIGMEKPREKKDVRREGYQCVLALSGRAAATSGNYRNFRYRDGVRYAHTIDPRTGRPVEREILSATMVARSCYEADAWATAAMVMGLEKTKEALRDRKEPEAYLVYRDSTGAEAVWMSGGFEKYVK